MQFEPKDIFLIDASIIGGFLILLTISSFSPSEFPNRSIFITIAVTIVIFFAMASYFFLTNNNKGGMDFTKIGFISIIIFMIFIGVVNFINIIDPTIWSENAIGNKIATSNSTAIT